MFLAIWLLPGLAWGGLDLERASVVRLSNGLTVILLEDRGFPAVSVQMLYRAGGRDEEYGRTGLAHFLEHMAFRASDNFPDTALVSRIYAAGGEWHGYTWIDQTTYFQTVPVPELDTALKIEADRMQGLKIPAEDLEAERGAVLSEMHGYENDPASRLHDQLVFASIVGHPYRNNVIGLESDVRKIQLEDIRSFYRDHYHPGNAVLAIVGDMNSRIVLARIKELFGDFPAREPTPMPRTVEPQQQGLRRITLSGPGTSKLFEIAYHAPSVRHEDFSAFLVLQELLGGSGGVNFEHSNSVTPVAPESALGGLGEGLRTWYPPSADTYLFTISGAIARDADATQLEQELERRISSLRETPVAAGQLAQAIEALRRQLIFDVETTEDAAHQLAYFEGLGALQVLFDLDASIAAVTVEDVRQAARRYLQPAQRSIGWYLPGPQAQAQLASRQAPLRYGQERQPETGPETGPGTEAASEPVLAHLSGGMPVIFQRAPATPTAHVRLLFQGEQWSGGELLETGDPDFGLSSLQLRCLNTELGGGLDRLLAQMKLMSQSSLPGVSDSGSPSQRLEFLLKSAVSRSLAQGAGKPAPVAIVVAGDLELSTLMDQLENHFGPLTPARFQPDQPAVVSARRLVSLIDHPLAQAQLGYAVPAPALSSPEAGPWQALLYILTHGYEGRLGKEAISRRGLIYYIDSGYHSDSQGGWISLGISVDPEKFVAMRALFEEQMDGLKNRPPSQQEVDEARHYLLGRYLTQHQSNTERTGFMGRQFVQYGEIPSAGKFRAGVESITREQVLAIIPAFTAGSQVEVRQADPETAGR